MNSFASPQLIALPQTADQTESAVARRIREIRQSALSIISQALSSPLISEAQREVATAKAAHCHDINQLLRWHRALVSYVAGIKAGSRQPVADPQPAPEPEQQLVAEPVASAQQMAQPVAAEAPRRIYRKARRMSPEKLLRLRAANQARREAAEQQRTPLPMWAEAPRLNALPGGLYWSGQGEVPEVGKALMVSRPGGLSGKATVKGYFHAEGFLGIVADFEKVPAKFQQSPRSQYVFGRDLQAVAA